MKVGHLEVHFPLAGLHQVGVDGPRRVQRVADYVADRSEVLDRELVLRELGGEQCEVVLQVLRVALQELLDPGGSRHSIEMADVEPLELGIGEEARDEGRPVRIRRVVHPPPVRFDFAFVVQLLADRLQPRGDRIVVEPQVLPVELCSTQHGVQCDEPCRLIEVEDARGPQTTSPKRLEQCNRPNVDPLALGSGLYRLRLRRFDRRSLEEPRWIPMAEAEVLGVSLPVRNPVTFVEPDDGSFTKAVVFDQQLSGLLLEGVEAVTLAVDVDLDELETQGDQILVCQRAEEEPLVDEPARLRVLNGEAPHALDRPFASDLDQQGPLLGMHPVIPQRALQPYADVCALSVVLDARRHPRVVIGVREELCDGSLAVGVDALQAVQAHVDVEAIGPDLKLRGAAPELVPHGIRDPSGQVANGLRDVLVEHAGEADESRGVQDHGACDEQDASAEHGAPAGRWSLLGLHSGGPSVTEPGSFPRCLRNKRGMRIDGVGSTAYGA